MSRRRSLLVALTLAASLAACASETGSGSLSSSPTASATETEELDDDEQLEVDAEALGCTYEDHDVEGGHTDDPEYDRHPPEGGIHQPLWEYTGVHDDPIEDGLQAHNLEHGHVGLQYDEDEVSDETVELLEEIGEDEDEWIFVAPYEDFDDDNVLAVTAWGQRIDCPEGFTEDADALGELIEDFDDLFRDEAPESIAGQPIG